MRFVNFKKPGGDAVVVIPEHVGAILQRGDDEAIIRVVGRPEDIHVQGTVQEVVDALQEPVIARLRRSKPRVRVLPA